VAKMTLLEFIASEEGRAAIIDGVDRALEELRKHLPSAVFGGTELAFNVSILHPKSGAQLANIVRDHLTCDTPDPENGKYNYVRIASGKQDVSFRAGVSMREAKERGWVHDYDIQWIGNTVSCLDKEGDYKLVVSCSGLRDLCDEMAAELIASNVKLELLRAYYALAA
jgi:hypothetical protein